MLKGNDWKPMNKGFEFSKIMEWEKRNPEQAGLFPHTEQRPDVEDGKYDKSTDKNTNKTLYLIPVSLEI